MPVSDLIVVFAAALLLVAFGTPVCRRIALRVGLVDHPSDRKLHTEPVPLLGGPAIILAVLVSTLLYPERAEMAQLTSILLGGILLSLFGLWDDRRGLHPAAKLLVQIAAGLLLLGSGVEVSLDLPQWANVALTLFWVVGITNAFNLLDNMDGLAACIAAVAAACFALLAFLNGDYHVAALSLALLGACLGFLFHNFDPARIFMGDSGALFLGFLLAGLAIELRFPDNVRTVTWMVPILALGLPVFDTTLVVVSRLRRRSNPLTTPGKDHVSHHLLRLGWTTRGAVLLCSLVSCALAGAAILVSVLGLLAAYLCASTVALVGVMALVWLQFHVGFPEEQR